MPEVIRPTWADLQEVVGDANSQLIVCSPYFSAKGIGRVFDDLSETLTLKFWTVLSPHDWAKRVSDPDELLALLEILNSGDTEVELKISRQLHAKAYAADYTLALIGSANLSEGGFGTNLELAVRLRHEEASEAVEKLEQICVPVLRGMTLDQLRTWVEAARPAIKEYRSATAEEPEMEILTPVQSELDRILNFGGADSSDIVKPTLAEMETFIEWLEHNDMLAGADVLYRRHHNLDRQNLQGHVKQGFFASMRFLSEHPEFREMLSAELELLKQDDIFPLEITAPIAQTWQEHLDAHAIDSDDNYSYSTLRTILPPSLGGTRSGGGGGSSTIKRMVPLVARFLSENS